MQKPEVAADIESIANEAPSRDWHKPVATFRPANSAENGPGTFPDAGVDFS